MRQIVLSVSRNLQRALARDAVLAQSGGFAVAPALSVESALEKVDMFPFCCVVLGASLSLEEKRRFMAALRGKKRIPVISLRGRGERASGADIELDALEPQRLVQAIATLA